MPRPPTTSAAISHNGNLPPASTACGGAVVAGPADVSVRVGATVGVGGTAVGGEAGVGIEVGVGSAVGVGSGAVLTVTGTEGGATSPWGSNETAP